MFRKQCLKLGSTALLLIAALLIGGCGTTTLYRATPEDTRDLSPVQARKLLIKTAQFVSGCNAPYIVAQRVHQKFGTVTYEKYQSTCDGPYRFAEYPDLVATSYVGDPVEGRRRSRAFSPLRIAHFMAQAPYFRVKALK